MTRHLPTIVLTAGLSILLAVAALFVTQRAGWLSIGRPTAGSGSATGGTAAAACPHTLTTEVCPFCTPSLIERKGFCHGHGVPEALCHLCDPSVIPAFKAQGDWCAEHDAPESLCPVCAPGAGLKYRSSDERVPAAHSAQTPPPTFRQEQGCELSEGAMEPAPVEIGILRDGQLPYVPQPGRVVCDTESMRVRIAPGIGERIGLEVVESETLPLRVERIFNAQLDYNRNRLAELASRAPGVVVEVLKETGSAVAAGETLAVIDSTEVGNAKAELLQAQALVALRAKDHERERALHERGVSSEAEALAAGAALAEARIALSRARQILRNLGFGDADIDGFAARDDTAPRTAVTAPFDGVVIERSAAPGEVVGTEKVLFRITDLSVMWAYLDVFESDLSHVRQGQPVLFVPDGMAGVRFPGRITRVGTEVEPTTRTLRARAELANPDGLLRANLFGKAAVTLRGGEPAVVVPKTAVQWEGCCHVVFVRQSDMLYQPRKVQLGHELDKHYEIVAGLAGGERIVTTGSFLLKTEIMKGSIGAGCCEANPGA